VAAVFAECSLSVMQTPGLVLAEAFRILRPGGKLVLTDVYARCQEGALLLRRRFAEDLPAVMIKEELEGCLREAGFSVLVWEDHSYVWKEYVAQLILENRPLYGCCWRGIADEQPNLRDFLAIMKQIRPGYCLLVAEKADRCACWID
jgi:ubiquinone/menaquinone biosynthesis C-methylase UbiE